MNAHASTNTSTNTLGTGPNPAQLAIVTGHSRGMGRAIADRLHRLGWTVLGLSRQARGAPFEEWTVDLADPLPVAERLQAQLAARPTPRQAVLINNAALLTAPGPLADTDLASLSAAARVGLEAPMLLAAAFERALAACPDRRIVHISSGLGRRAMAGAAPYCAVKAGLDHLSRAMALDGSRVVSLAPGIIDTDMQVQLRGGDPARFPDRARFQAFKDEGLLDTPEGAAEKVVNVLLRENFGHDPIGDVRA